MSNLYSETYLKSKSSSYLSISQLAELQLFADKFGFEESELRHWLSRPQFSVVLLALRWIQNQLSHGISKEQQCLWSKSLSTIRVPAETQCLLLWAQVTVPLHLDCSPSTFPDWRSWQVSEVVRVSWMKSELLLFPSLPIAETEHELFSQALSLISPTEIVYPSLFLTTLVQKKDWHSQHTAYHFLQACLEHGTLTVVDASNLLQSLLQSDILTIRVLAWKALAQPWAQGSVVPPSVLHTALFSETTVLAESALEWAGQEGRWREVSDVMFDSSSSPALRQLAMKWAGKIACKSDVCDMLELALQDPWLFGTTCLQSMEEMHQRGVFLDPENLELFTALIDELRFQDGRVLACLTYISRKQLFSWLSGMDTNDSRWHHWIEIFSFLEVNGVISWFLDWLPTIKNERLLRKALWMVGPMAKCQAESTLLAFLHDHPHACLHSLQWAGAEQTVQRLMTDLGMQADGSLTSIADYLVHYQEKALTLIWFLAPFSDCERDRWREHFHLKSVPIQIQWQKHSTMSLRHMMALVSASSGNKVKSAIKIIGNYGNYSSIPLLSELIAKLVFKQNLQRSESLETPVHSWQSPLPKQLHDPAIDSDVLQSVRKLGNRLQQQGAIRPTCLIDSDPSNAGERFLAEILLGLIERNDLNEGELSIVFHTLADLKGVELGRRVARWIRSPHPDIRKMAIRCLVKDKVVELVFNIMRLTEENDVETIRQALLAMGSFQATWASDAVASCLEHPNMNIKKTAAEMLSVVGRVSAVPRIIFWLSMHDNPGFRDKLLHALQAVMGNSTTLALRLACERTATERQRKLLIATLDGRLSPAVVRAWTLGNATQKSLAKDVLNALISRQIELKDGNLASLQSEMERVGIPIPFTKSESSIQEREPIAKPWLDLINKGWDSQQAILALRSHQKPSKETEQVVEYYYREWLHLFPQLILEDKQSLIGLLMTMEPSQFSKQHAPILEQCFDEFFSLLPEIQTREHRQRFCAWLQWFIPHASAEQRAEIAHRIRSVFRVPSADGLGRWSVLQACQVPIVTDDLLSFVEDVSGSSQPILAWKTLFHQRFIIPIDCNPEVQTYLREILQSTIQKDDCEHFESLKERLSSSPSERECLPGVIVELIAKASHKMQTSLLLWIAELQPAGVPRFYPGHGERQPEEEKVWRELNEQAISKAVPPSYERGLLLVAQLSDTNDNQKEMAAQELLSWHDPKQEFGSHVLSVFLNGSVSLSWKEQVALSDTIGSMSSENLRDLYSNSNHLGRLRLLNLCEHLGEEDLLKHRELLLSTIHEPDLEQRNTTLRCLQRISAARLFPDVKEAVLRGAFGSVQGLGSRLFDCPQTREVKMKLASHPTNEYANFFLAAIVPGCFAQTPLSNADLERKVAKLQERKSVNLRISTEITNATTHYQEILAMVRSEQTDVVHAGLRKIRHYPRPEVAEEVIALTKHRDLKVRTRALRCLRDVGTKHQYVETMANFLDDPRPELKILAIRVLSKAGYVSGIVPIIDLLEDHHSRVRRVAEEGLIVYGEQAVRSLERAKSHARPDHKQRYQSVLSKIQPARLLE
jgi:hypothetical protein